MAVLIRAIRFLARWWPALATEIVWRLWRTPRKPHPPSEGANAIMADAARKWLTSQGHRIATYRWGDGPRVILLAHGWEGRASDFAPMVQELCAPERTIVALDAPGHGESGGRRTTVIEYAAVLGDVGQQLGQLEAAISHSFGTPSVATAAQHHALRADRFVSLSGVADLSTLVPTFCDALGLPESMSARVRARIENAVFDADHAVWERYSAAACPIPAPSPLLIIHDRSDRMVGFAHAALLAEAHGSNTRMLATEGLGHSRILKAEPVLDAVKAFLTDPDASSPSQAAP